MNDEHDSQMSRYNTQTDRLQGHSMGMAQGGGQIAKARIPFEVAMDGLRTEIEHLNGKMGELESRLAGYCSQQPAETNAEIRKEAPGNSSAIESIAGQTEILTGMRRRLAYLIDSLEI